MNIFRRFRLFSHASLLQSSFFSWIVSIGIVLALSSSNLVGEGALRDWTDQAGRVISGKLTRVEGDNVSIQIDGKDFLIPTSSLSKVDQEYIQKWIDANVKVAETTSIEILENTGPFSIVSETGEITKYGGDSSGNAAESGSSDPGGNDASKNNVTVAPGETIRVEPGGRVQGFASNGAVVSLESETEVKVPPSNGAERSSSLELLKGKLFINVDGDNLKRDGREFRLKIPTAILSVKGTKFFTDLAGNNLVVGVGEGKVSADFGNGKTIVTNGGNALVVTGGESKERPLERQELDEIQSLTDLVKRSSILDPQWDWKWNWQCNLVGNSGGLQEKQLPGSVMEIVVPQGRFSASMEVPVPKPELKDEIIGAEIRLTMGAAGLTRDSYDLICSNGTFRYRKTVRLESGKPEVVFIRFDSESKIVIEVNSSVRSVLTAEPPVMVLKKKK